MFLLTGKENHKDIRPFDINYTYLGSKLWNVIENWGTPNLEIFKFKVEEIYGGKENDPSKRKQQDKTARSKQNQPNSSHITLNTLRIDTPQLVTSSVSNKNNKNKTKREEVNFLT